MNSGIYQISGPDGKLYIGQSQNIGQRFSYHKTRLCRNKHDNSHLQNAWNKHGPEAFTFQALAYFDPADLNEAEQYLLDRLPADKKYNIAICAEVSGRGLKRSPEVRAKMKGRKFSSEHCRRISESSKGKKMSPEACARNSAARKGKKLSPETCAKMSASHKGLKHTPEDIVKMKAAQLKRWASWRRSVGES